MEEIIDIHHPHNKTDDQFYSQNADILFIALYSIAFLANIFTAVMIKAWKSFQAIIIFVFLTIMVVDRIVGMSLRISKGGYLDHKDLYVRLGTDLPLYCFAIVTFGLWL